MGRPNGLRTGGLNRGFVGDRTGARTGRFFGADVVLVVALSFFGS